MPRFRLTFAEVEVEIDDSELVNVSPEERIEFVNENWSQLIDPSFPELVEVEEIK